MGNVMINGMKILIDESINLQDLLIKEGYTGEAFAVAINNDFVSRTIYSTVIVSDGDCLDIVMPMQGG